MTAPVISDGITREIVFDGDAKTRELRPLRVRGQLWERLTERGERTFRNVWRGDMPRGPRAQWLDMTRERSGIIHAGTRIK